MIKRLLALSLFAASLWGQGQGQAVNQVSGPPPFNGVSLYFYNGSNQVIYICNAPSLIFPATTYYKSSSTLTNIVVLTNVATMNLSATAQFWVGQQFTVAGSATTALNGTYKATAVSGSTVTFTTAGVADATYTDATLTVSTSAPLLNALVWSIQAFSYASTNLATNYFGGNPSVSVPQGLACSNRANY